MWKNHLLQEMQRKQVPLLFLAFDWMNDNESKIRISPTKAEYINTFKTIEEEQLSTLMKFPRVSLMVIFDSLNKSPTLNFRANY